jgi:hypothetical protein
MLSDTDAILSFIMMVALRLVRYNRKPSFGHYPRWSQDSACYILKLDDTVLDASGSTEISSC